MDNAFASALSLAVPFLVSSPTMRKKLGCSRPETRKVQPYARRICRLISARSSSETGSDGLLRAFQIEVGLLRQQPIDGTTEVEQRRSRRRQIRFDQQMRLVRAFAVPRRRSSATTPLAQLRRESLKGDCRPGNDRFVPLCSGGMVNHVLERASEMRASHVLKVD